MYYIFYGISEEEEGVEEETGGGLTGTDLGKLRLEAVVISRFKEAVIEQTEKVFTAFVTWGIGVILMTMYCLVVYGLYKFYGLYITIIGAMLFLTIAYFLIDLWWNFKRGGFDE